MLLPFITRVFQNFHDLGRYNVCYSTLRQPVFRCFRQHYHVSLRSPVDQDFPVISVFPDYEWNASYWTHIESKRPRAVFACPDSVDPNGHFLNASLLRREGKNFKPFLKPFLLSNYEITKFCTVQ